MVAKLKTWFERLILSMEKSGMERARKHIQQHGYGRWE